MLLRELVEVLPVHVGLAGGGADVALVTLEQPSSEGALHLLGASAVVQNGFLGVQGNAALALGLAGEHPTLVWYVASPADLAGGDTPLSELYPGWVNPVAWLALTVGLAAAIWRGRRLGPVVIENLPVVVIVPRGPNYEKVVTNLTEVRAREGKVLAIASRGDAEIGTSADDVVLIPHTDQALQPILTTLPLQMLAYYVADFKGTDIDQPRNLAKSVTVE